eukprot:COSAG02_NODE_1206_length_13888_cov_15.018130_2_plen_528_part_00
MQPYVCAKAQYPCTQVLIPRRSGFRYRNWRSENPRCFGTAVEQALQDEAKAKHKKRVQSARASLRTSHADSRLADYARFRARMREARLAKTAGLSRQGGQRVLEHPPWRPNSPKPKRRPRSAPTKSRGDTSPRGRPTRETAQSAGRLAEVITQAGLVPDDAEATAALANMLAEDQRQLNSEVEVAEGAKKHVYAVREQQRVYMEAMEAGATLEDAEAAAAAAAPEVTPADDAQHEPSTANGVERRPRREKTGATQQAGDTATGSIWTGSGSVDYTAKDNDHVELKAYKSPPPTVKMVMEAVCLVLGMAPTWDAAKTLLGKSTSELRNTFSELRVETISKATLRKLKKNYIGKPALDYFTAAKTSKAVCALCLWVNNIYRAATGQEQVSPPAPTQPAKRKATKKRPVSAGASSRGGSPGKEGRTPSSSKRPSKKAAKKGVKKSNRVAQIFRKDEQGQVDAIDSNDLVGTVSMAVQNGLSGDELLRLCESLGKGTMEMASTREVSVHAPLCVHRFFDMCPCRISQLSSC